MCLDQMFPFQTFLENIKLFCQSSVLKKVNEVDVTDNT